MKNKSLILLIISVIFVFTLASCSGSKVNIFSDGKTEYTIVLAENASEDEQALAKELAALSGADPEILTDTSAETSLEILVGDTARAQTLNLLPTLEAKATTSAFNFIIAESDGKLIILSDSDIGYVYALDHIKSTYYKDGKLSVPKDVCDIQQVAWDIYYNSELYYERVVAEADKNLFDFFKDQLNNNGNDNNGNPITTVAEAIEAYKKLVSSFDTAAFGEYKSTDFTSKDIYDDPTVYPDESHPRIFFTENTIGEVREGLTAEQNSIAYKRYIALSNVACDGKFKSSGYIEHNFDADILARIEAKAFRYIMEKDSSDKQVAESAKIFGYEAIYAIKNAILTLDLPDSVQDGSRSISAVLAVVAYVYDWCYDLLSEEDKAQIIAGGVNLVGKQLEVVRAGGAMNKAPTGQDPAHDHGAEYQILHGYLSFAIACYGEADEIYELVGGRVLNNYVDMQNWYAQSGSYWQGSCYSSFRGGATLLANLLINRMTDGEVTPFENFDKVVNTITYYFRPDGDRLRIGDFGTDGGTVYKYDYYDASCMFYAASLYAEEYGTYFKSFAYDISNEFNDYTGFYFNTVGLSPTTFLALNDPDIDYVYEGTAPLTNTTTYPLTNIFAKSAQNDPDAYMVYMTMPEAYILTHSHMDCGSFQIYYKGILASNSGSYDTTKGSTHLRGYSTQTISKNSIIVYNPNLQGTYYSKQETMLYAGGQSIQGIGYPNYPKTLEELLEMPRLLQCVSLGLANVEDESGYRYSYMGGDMTGAYDEETVDEVTRYMFSFDTGNEDFPLAFLTFDRITSDEASYHKSALIHMQMEPTLTDDGYIIVTNTENGNSGKMVVQNIGFDVKYTTIGGEGKEFWIPGVDENGNYSLDDGYNVPQLKPLKGNYDEYGWGRVEISPTVAEKTNHILTVMYVTDATNTAAPIAATEIMSDSLVGAYILGKSVVFPKNDKLLEDASTFTLSEAQTGECFITGVKAGSWEIIKDGTTIKTVTVDDGTNLITFDADAGNYTIKPAN